MVDRARDMDSMDILLTTMLDAYEASNQCTARLKELVDEAKAQGGGDAALQQEIDQLEREADELSRNYIAAFKAYYESKARID